MASIRYTCGCTRYMSPTRLSNVHTRRQTELHLNQARWRSAPSSPSSRWRSVTSSVTQRLPRVTTSTGATEDDVLSASAAATERDHTEPEVKKADRKFVSSRLNALAGSVRSARDWTAESAAKLDPKGISKLLSVLNIDLPKYQRFLANSTKMVSFSTADDIERIKRQQLEEKRARVFKKMESMESEKECHNFEQAMMSTQEGIQNYYSSVSGDSDAVKRVQAEQVTKERTIIENTQANIIDKVSRFTQILPGGDKEDKETEKRPVTKEMMVPRTTVDRRTRGLVSNLKKASSDSSKLNRLQDLCQHLIEYPKFAKNGAIKENIVPLLLKLRESSDVPIAEHANQALCLVGYVNPVRGSGIRILTIDGGGTRGLIALEMMRQLETSTGQPIHQLFDFVCGVSTGALIAAILGIYKKSIDECERIYKKFSREMFDRSRLLGASKLVTTHAYYDTNLWENILKENVGLGTFLETMKDRECPKQAMVSTLVNEPTLQNYLFRNYTHATGVQSKYRGSINYAVWEGVRASAAAPGYYEEMKLGEHIHQDGGLLANNPTAIAIHESKMLWPSNDIQCVISVGTGRFRPMDEPTKSYKLKDKILKVVQSATDTEAVHTVVHDLLPPSTYFRFNPYLSDEFMLDEINEDRWEMMNQDALMYTRKNSVKFEAATKQLLLPKKPHHRAAEWARSQVEKYI